jgi:hypothetical protein
MDSCTIRQHAQPLGDYVRDHPEAVPLVPVCAARQEQRSSGLGVRWDAQGDEQTLAGREGRCLSKQFNCRVPDGAMVTESTANADK